MSAISSGRRKRCTTDDIPGLPMNSFSKFCKVSPRFRAPCDLPIHIFVGPNQHGGVRSDWPKRRKPTETYRIQTSLRHEPHSPAVLVLQLLPPSDLVQRRYSTLADIAKKTRRETECSAKMTPKMTLIGKTKLHSDGGWSLPLEQHVPRIVEPKLQMEPSGRHAKLLPEKMGNIIGASTDH
jgi:hypothetical protein